MTREDVGRRGYIRPLPYRDFTYNKYLEGTLALTAEKMRLDKSARQSRRL